MKTIKSLTEAELAEYPKLPIGWQWARLGEIADNIQYGYTESSTDEPIGPKFLRITDIQNNEVIWKSVPYCKIDDAKKQNYMLKDGDLVFARTGATVGKSYLLKGDFPESVFASYLIRVRLLKEVSESFVYNFFQSLTYWKQITEGQVGIGQPNVNGTKLSLLIVPVAPLPEQRAIVSKIEQLFSELDNGISNLKLAQEQLKVYRQAVLKKAFEGELTRAWRKLNSEGKSANKLLGLILEKKKMQWESDQLSKFERTGKKPKDNLWKLKYKEPCSPDTANLPDLPKSWSWVSPEQITSWDDPYALAIGPFGSNLKVSDYTSEGVPLVFVRNIRSGVFDNENTKYVSKPKAEELRPHWINSLDILVTKMGEPPGDACLYPIGHPLAIITADCIKFRLCSLLDNPIYFVYAINSNIVRSQISSITLGVAQKKISLERFKTITLPLPPIEEQQAIVQEIETRLSVCDKIEQDILTNLEKAEALRQSILKKAFEGKLLNEKELAEVRKAEDWEPAEGLLERTKAE